MNSFVKYENDGDRTNQQKVSDILLAYLSVCPVTGTGLDGVTNFDFKQTPQHLNLPQDVDIYHHGRYVAVAEVKCRIHKRYTREFFEQEGVLIKKKTLTALREQHYNNGRHVLLVMRTVDNHVLYADMRELLKNHTTITEAPDGYCKDDHGEKDSDDAGLILPLSLFKEIAQ